MTLTVHFTKAIFGLYQQMRCFYTGLNAVNSLWGLPLTHCGNGAHLDLWLVIRRGDLVKEHSHF